MIWDSLANFPARRLPALLPQPTRPECGPVWQQILGPGMLVTMRSGLVAGHAGQVIGRRLGAVNRCAAAIPAGLAIGLARE